LDDLSLEHIRFQGVPAAREGTVRREFPPGGSGLPVRKARGSREDIAPEVRECVRWLLTQAGIDAGAYRAEPFSRRMSALLRVARASAPVLVRHQLERSPHLIPAAISTVLLGVSGFFRDPAVFDNLAASIAGLGPSCRGLRAWSVGCSDGAELYSVAMLLDELGRLDGCDLLGTDCRPDAIQAARTGGFGPRTPAGLSPARRTRYLADEPNGLRVIERLRRYTRWAVRDLLAATEPGPWDLVLWRNSAIYLRACVANQVWRRVAEELAPGGLLVTGRAERPRGVPGLIQVSPCLYRKNGGPTHER
jgi:chemotaxis methyl-accepting protein methylase